MKRGELVGLRNHFKKAAFPLLLVVAFARADSPVTSVYCVSHDVSPAPQCGSETLSVNMSTELGSGELSSFSEARRLIVKFLEGAPETAKVETQRGLAAGGRPTLTRDSTGTPVVQPGSAPAAGLRQKDAVVIVGPEAGLRTLEVDASAGVPGQNAGDAVIVADSLASLTVKTKGWEGRPGEPALERVAREAVENPQGFPQGIRSSFLSSRQSDPAASLSFTMNDVNNYAAAGLQCRPGEIPSGGPGTFAYDSAVAAGQALPAQNMTITAYGRQESRRSFCSRDPEYALTQECEAEKEYSFQASCQVVPESREWLFYKRSPVVWQRPVCTSTVQDQVRRSVIRTAFVEVINPAGTSFIGQVTRTITFGETYDVLRSRNATRPSGAPQEVVNDVDGAGVLAFNPFWDQAAGMENDATTQVAPPTITGSLTQFVVPNNHIADSYPTAIAGDNTGPFGASGSDVNRLKASPKVRFEPRAIPNDAPGARTLFTFKPTGHKWGDTWSSSGTSTVRTVKAGSDRRYTVEGCMDVLPAKSNASETSPKNPEERSNNKWIVSDSIKAGAYSGGASYEQLVNSYLALRLEDIFPSVDSIGDGALIRVSGCMAYTSIDGVYQATVAYGDFQKVSDQSFSLSCANPYPNRVGTETFFQFEREDTCYASDPTATIGGVDAKTLPLANFSTQSNPGFIRSFDNLLYPESASESDKLVDANFCVPVAARQAGVSDVIQQDTLGVLRMTWSTPYDSFEFNTQSQSAIRRRPRTQDRKCAQGIRLDIYKQNMPLAARGVSACTNGFASSMSVVKASTDFGAAKWATYDEAGIDAIRDPSNALSEMTLRSRLIERRYDDLPVIQTSRTHLVDPAFSVSPASSLTSREFPPAYQPKVNGARASHGWMRELDLRSSDGSAISPSTFIPFGGSSTFERGKAWCEAPAYSLRADGGVGRDFGARGMARDVSKRIFGFEASISRRNEDGSTAAAEAFKRYVAVEVVGDDNTESGSAVPGFSGPAASVPRSAGQFSSADESTRQTQLITAFWSHLYPNLGSRVAVSCPSGETFNWLAGVCVLNAGGASAGWLPTTRLIQRLDRNGAQKPWVFSYGKETLDDPVLTAATGGCDGTTSGLTKCVLNASSTRTGERLGGGVSPTDNLYRFSIPDENQAGVDVPRASAAFRMGAFRPYRNVPAFGDVGVQTNALYRPEAVFPTAAVMAPTYAASLGFTSGNGDSSSKRIHILAVPQDALYTHSGGNISGALSLAKDARLPVGTLIISFDIVRADVDGADTALARGAVYELRDLRAADGSPGSDGVGDTVDSVLASEGSVSATLEATTTQNLAALGYDGVASARKLRFIFSGTNNSPASQPTNRISRFEIRDIYEAMVAGASATSGQESLNLVGVETPLLRNRAQEAAAAGKTWKSRVTTGPTDSSTDISADPRACAVRSDSDSPWLYTLQGSVSVGGQSYEVDVAGGQFQTVPSVISNGDALTAEELSLFTKPVTGSIARKVTRQGLWQWTPWSHELPPGAPRNVSVTTSRDFGSWSTLDSTGQRAPVPSCEIFDGAISDTQVARSSLTSPSLSALLETASPETGYMRFNAPAGTPLASGPVKHFLRLRDPAGDPADAADARKSDSCIRWDSVTGTRCELFSPTVGGPESATSYTFGGSWRPVYFETAERIAQDCQSFDGQNTNQCSTPVAVGAPRTEVCSAGSCAFPTTTETYQIDASYPIPGSPGEDGTDSGQAFVFCRDCQKVLFQGRAGLGGVGSAPVSSTQSKTLQCLSWNGNPANPIFQVRNIWSRPFSAGSAGAPGRNGNSRGGISVYGDIPSEVIEEISDPLFWRGSNRDSD